MIECPTCGFSNAPTASHCERCARPLDDVRLGLREEPEVEADQDRAKRPITRPDPIIRLADLATATTPGSDNAFEVSPRIALGGLSAALPELTDTGTSNALREAVVAAPRPDKPRQTVHEGLPAIVVPPELRPGAAPAPASASSGFIPALPRPAAAETQAALPAVQWPLPAADPEGVPAPPPFPAPEPVVIIEHRTDIGAGFFAGVGVTVLVAGLLVAVWHSFKDQPDLPDEPPSARAGRVPVVEGDFLVGLSNDFRLMFSNTCKKVAENPEVECKEDVALKDEYPMVTATLTAFQIDVLEVSNADWARCVEAAACPAVSWDKCENRTTQGYMPFLRVPEELREPTRPVVCVTQAEAKAYCAFAGGRLPSAEEWEKAARGRDAFLFPWGSDWNPSLANWAEQDIARARVTGRLDGFFTTAPVGSFPKGISRFGALDMAGNAAEWVTRKQDTTLEATARGGSWLSNPAELRSTYRLFLQPETRRTDVGLRCAAAP